MGCPPLQRLVFDEAASIQELEKSSIHLNCLGRESPDNIPCFYFQHGEIPETQWLDTSSPFTEPASYSQRATVTTNFSFWIRLSRMLQQAVPSPVRTWQEDITSSGVVQAYAQAESISRRLQCVQVEWVSTMNLSIPRWSFELRVLTQIYGFDWLVNAGNKPFLFWVSYQPC